MLVKDTVVNDKPLYAVVIPTVMVRDRFEFKKNVFKRKNTTTLKLFLLEHNENTFNQRGHIISVTKKMLHSLYFMYMTYSVN